MTIFATPEPEISDSDIRILYLHGLKGSPAGAKALHLRAVWKAKSPTLRTQALLDLQEKYSHRPWAEVPREELAEALAPAYEDACAAVRYFEPDVVVGSSLGGALLAKMVMEARWGGNCVFLAPAIDALLGDVSLPEMRSAVWLLGECDETVPNIDNVKHCGSSGGNLLVSRDDDHRLGNALQYGLIDCAITTSLEISCAD